MTQIPSLISVLLGLSVSAQALANSGFNSKLTLSGVMREAAEKYPSIQANELRIAAGVQDQRAALMDSAQVTMGSGRSQSRGQFNGLGTSYSLNQRATSNSLVVQVTLSFETWMQARQLEIDNEIRKSMLHAQRMQLASEAAKAYFEFITSGERVEELGELATRLENSVRGARLSPGQRSSLASRLQGLRSSQRSARAKTTKARHELGRFIGRIPRDQEPQVNGDGLRGLWRHYDELIMIPRSVREAMDWAAKSPALVQAELGQSAARAQWQLNFSRALPKLVLSYSRFSGGLPPLDGPGARAHIETFDVALVATFSGGYLPNLSAARLRERAATLDTQAVQLELLTTVQKAYDDDRDLRAELRESEEGLREALNGLNHFLAQSLNDASATEVNQVVRIAEEHIANLHDTAIQYYINRINLLSAIGTLMDCLPQIERIERRL